MSEEIRATKLPSQADPPVAPIAVIPAEKPGLVLAEEQLAYAKLLDSGMKLGLLLIVVTFLVYVLGIMAPHTPVDDLPKYWVMPVKKYLEVTGIHAGWSWVALLNRGDFVNFVGIAFLAGVTLVCYVRIIPIFLRKNEKVYAWIAVLEVLVLALAASGVLKSGGH
jgi:hypothetical protein